MNVHHHKRKSCNRHNCLRNETLHEVIDEKETNEQPLNFLEGTTNIDEKGNECKVSAGKSASQPCSQASTESPLVRKTSVDSTEDSSEWDDNEFPSAFSLHQIPKSSHEENHYGNRHLLVRLISFKHGACHLKIMSLHLIMLNKIYSYAFRPITAHLLHLWNLLPNRHHQMV